VKIHNIAQAMISTIIREICVSEKMLDWSRKHAYEKVVEWWSSFA